MPDLPQTSSPIESGIRIHGVEFTRQGIFELDDGRRALFIDKKVISKCAFRRGFMAERVILGVIVGVGMTVGGAAISLQLVTAGGDDGSRLYLRFLAVGVTFFLLGAFIVRHTVRRGFYLELATRGGRRKLSVGKAFVAAQFTADLAEARNEYGYSIETLESDLGTP